MAIIQPKDVKTRSFATLRVVPALILREMSTRYGRSPGGYIWAVLDPLGTTLLLALAMSMLMSAPPLGASFVLFKATGMMPFTMYGNIWTSVAHAISFSRPLLRYPGVSWLDALLARLILNALTTGLVSCLIFAGLLAWSETGSRPDPVLILAGMALAVVFGFGVGCFQVCFFMWYPAWEHTWNILNRPMFLASGILFLYDSLPGVLRDILWFNPLVHIIALLRRGFYPMYEAPWISVTYVLVCALVPMVIGLLLLRRHHVDLLNL